MSDTIDLRLLGKMVARLQSTVEDVRQEYAGIRASVDSLSTTFYSRFAEFNVRMSGLELGQMKLAVSVDDAHSKIDRIESELEGVKSELDSVRSELEGVKSELKVVNEKQSEMDGKLDLILARLAGR